MSISSRLQRSPLHLFYRAHQYAQELLNDDIAALGITPRQYMALLAIRHTDEPSQTTITDLLGIDRSTVSHVIGTLVKKRLVKRKRTKADARAYCLTLTQEGADILAAADPIAERVDASLTRSMGARAIVALRSVTAARAAA